MDHEQLTLCSISVILHSRQSTGNLSCSGKTKCGPCRYPQRLQSVFRIHFHDSKATVPKVPREAPREGRVLEPTGARKPGQSWREPCQEMLAGLWTLQFIWLHWIFILCAASAWRQSCGDRKIEFLKNLVADQCDWPYIGPWLQPELLAPGDLMPPGLMSGWCNLELNSLGYQIAALEYINSWISRRYLTGH